MVKRFVTTKANNNLRVEGLIGPIELFTQEVAKDKFTQILKEKQQHEFNTQIWYKSLHQTSKTVLNIATENSLLKIVKDHLGDNLLLWGSQLIHQGIDSKHRWHRDVEHEKWPGITIWIALDGLSIDTTISFVAKSHLISPSPQHFIKNNLNLTDTESVITTAKGINEGCELLTYILKEGEFMAWDGPMWHSTSNSSHKVRSALILQFCSSSCLPLMPKTFDSPPTFFNVPVPSVLIHGVNLNPKNWIINQ
jgi:ectoine hydroxylase-related dioxygenase (phytanoyl-CoA dioxygenase family)